MDIFEKARKRKSRKKWYIIRTKSRSYYIWALPFIPLFVFCEFLADLHYKKLRWNEKTATKVLNKVVPEVSEWDSEDSTFFYSTEWDTVFMVRHSPLLYRKWARKFQSRLAKFLVEKFEIEGYEKAVVSEYGCGEAWVKFSKK